MSISRKKTALSIQKGSPDRFGYEWGAYSKMVPQYEEQFRRWTTLIPKTSWEGASFLDVGCGMGRNSYWPLQYGASRGVSIDVDERSLEAARSNLSQFSNVEVRNVSAYEIPDRDTFDIVFSIGVIHHLEHPQLALQKMVQAARPGGGVLIWVYGYENSEWVVKFFNPFRTLLFSKLPVSVTHALSIVPTAFLWVFLRMGLGRIAYFKLLRTFSFSHLRSIVFDQMLPHIAHYWRREEVEDLMKQAGLSDIQLSPVNDMSWCALGKKPT
jgi:SAM-dependent methyltransferase